MLSIRLLLGFCVVVMLSVTTTGCENLSPETVIARAEQAILKRDYQSAAIDLKAILQRDPQNVRARWLLGEVYLAVQNGTSAEKELSRASRLGVADDAVLPAMAHALLMQKKYEKLLTLEPEQEITSLSAGELAAFKTLAHLGQRQLDDARRLISTAVRQAPQSTWVQFAEASVLAASQELDAALEKVQKLNDDVPEFPDAWTLKGNVLGAQKEYAAAEVAYSKAITLRVQQVEDRSKRAIVRMALGKWDKVMADAKALMQLAPGHFLGYYLAGTVYYQDGKLVDAQESLERAVELGEQHFPSVMLLATVEARLGDSARGRQLAEQALALVPNHIDARKLVAFWHLKDGKFREVENLIGPLANARPDDMEAKNMLATALLGMGRAAEAAELFDAVSLARPDSPASHLRAGLAALEAGQSERGLSALRRVDRMEPASADTNTGLIGGFLKQSATVEALAAAQRYADKAPGNPVALNLLAAAQLATGNQKSGYATYEKVLALQPGDVKAHRAVAMRALVDKDWATAAEHLDAALEGNPGNVQLLLMRAELAESMGDPALQVRLLDDAIERAPEEEESSALRAKLYLDAEQPEDALSLVRRFADTKHIGVLATRAEANYRLGRYGDAQTDLETLASLQPDSVPVQWQLVRVYAALNERQKLARSLQRLAEMAPDNPLVKLSEARLAALDGNESEVERLLAATGLPSDDADLLSTRIMLAERQNDTMAEIASRAKLLKVQPSAENAMALSRAYSSAEMDQDAGRVLEDWLRDNGTDLSPRLQLANLKEANGDVAGAVTELRRVLDADPDNVIALNNLAWHLRESAPAEALGLAESAHRNAPNSIVTIDTYAMVLAENRKFEEALRWINDVIDRARDKQPFVVHRALIRRKSGDVEGAVRDLRSILDGYPTDDIRRQAEQALRQIEG